MKFWGSDSLMEREVYLWLKEELFQIPKAGGKLSTRELKKMHAAQPLHTSDNYTPKLLSSKAFNPDGTGG